MDELIKAIHVVFTDDFLGCVHFIGANIQQEFLEKAHGSYTTLVEDGKYFQINPDGSYEESMVKSVSQGMQLKSMENYPGYTLDCSWISRGEISTVRFLSGGRDFVQYKQYGFISPSKVSYFMVLQKKTVELQQSALKSHGETVYETSDHSQAEIREACQKEIGDIRAVQVRFFNDYDDNYIYVGLDYGNIPLWVKSEVKEISLSLRTIHNAVHWNDSQMRSFQDGWEVAVDLAKNEMILEKMGTNSDSKICVLKGHVVSSRLVEKSSQLVEIQLEEAEFVIGDDSVCGIIANQTESSTVTVRLGQFFVDSIFKEVLAGKVEILR